MQCGTWRMVPLLLLTRSRHGEREGLLGRRTLLSLGMAVAMAVWAGRARADPAESLGLGFEGRAGAGAVAASATADWASVFYNPANLGLTRQPAASLAGLYVANQLSPSEAKAPAGAFAEFGAVMPAWPFGELPLYFGMGALTPSDSFYEIDVYPVETATYGLYNSRERRLSLSLGLGARVARWLAIGASVEMLPTVSTNVDLDLADSQGPNTLRVNVGYQLNPIVGVTVLPVPQLRFGLVWRGANRTKLDLPVAVDAEGIDLEALIQAETFFVPHRITLGSRWDFIPGLFAELDLSWQNYSAMPHPSAEVAMWDSEGEDTLGTKPPSARTHDVFTAALGAGWDGPVDLRLGYRFQPDPFSDATTRSNLLSGDEHLLTVGARIPLLVREEKRMATGEAGEANTPKGFWFTATLFGAYVAEKRQYKEEFSPENPGFPSIESGGTRFGFSVGVEGRY